MYNRNIYTCPFLKYNDEKLIIIESYIFSQLLKKSKKFEVTKIN